MPLGAMLGLSSPGPAVSTCIWRVPKSCVAIWNRPPSRRTNAKPLPSGNGRARNVVRPVERHPLDGTAAKIQPVDLRTAAAVRREQQRLAVGREMRFGVDARRRHHPLHVAAVGVHQEELRPALLGERDREPAAIGRPRRRTVAAAEVGHRLPSARGQVLHVDDRLPAFERHVGDARAVGRPARRQQRLVRRHDRLRIGAVGIGDQQLVARSRLGDIGDARREHPGVAGQLLVDHVGDLVRRGAELRAA